MSSTKCSSCLKASSSIRITPFRPVSSRRSLVTKCAARTESNGVQKLLSSVTAASVALAVSAGGAAASIQDLPVAAVQPQYQVAFDITNPLNLNPKEAAEGLKNRSNEAVEEIKGSVSKTGNPAQAIGGVQREVTSAVEDIPGKVSNAAENASQALPSLNIRNQASKADRVGQEAREKTESVLGGNPFLRKDDTSSLPASLRAPELMVVADLSGIGSQAKGQAQSASKDVQRNVSSAANSAQKNVSSAADSIQRNISSAADNAPGKVAGAVKDAAQRLTPNTGGGLTARGQAAKADKIGREARGKTEELLGKNPFLSKKTTSSLPSAGHEVMTLAEASLRGAKQQIQSTADDIKGTASDVQKQVKSSNKQVKDAGKEIQTRLGTSSTDANVKPAAQRLAVGNNEMGRREGPKGVLSNLLPGAAVVKDNLVGGPRATKNESSSSALQRAATFAPQSSITK